MVEIVRERERAVPDSKGWPTRYPKGASATQVTETGFARTSGDYLKENYKPIKD